jgi:uncharacterized membrane protein
MKKLPIWLLSFGFLVLIGCTRSSSPGGGPDRATKFTIEGPVIATSIKPGESDTVSLKVNRGKEFVQTVQLKAQAPTGIDVVLTDSAVKPAEKGDVQLKIAVAKDTTPGEHIIQVTGTPETGSAASLDVKVKVAQRSDTVRLTLQAPSGTTSIKQGETQLLKLALDPRDKYLADIKLAVEAPPKGVHAEISPRVTITSADKGEANLKVTVDKNAPLGEQTIRVTGTAEAATITSADVKIKVVEP